MRITITAPARWIEPARYDRFAALAEAAGFTVAADPQVFEQAGQLAGDDKVRAAALMAALNDPQTDIVWAARGGYGAMRLLPLLTVPERPVILAGYSDITTLMFGALGPSVTCLHAAMPVDLEIKPQDGVAAALAALRARVSGTGPEPEAHCLAPLRKGNAEAPVFAANLAVLTALLGTKWAPVLPPHILILEDVGEYKYALDRLFWRLSQSPLAPAIRGLVLGDFTALEDNEIPWGAEPSEMALDHFPDVPVAARFPLGHGDQNMPVWQGRRGTLTVSGESAEIRLGRERGGA